MTTATAQPLSERHRALLELLGQDGLDSLLKAKNECFLRKDVARFSWLNSGNQRLTFVVIDEYGELGDVQVFPARDERELFTAYQLLDIPVPEFLRERRTQIETPADRWDREDRMKRLAEQNARLAGRIDEALRKKRAGELTDRDVTRLAWLRKSLIKQTRTLERLKQIGREQWPETNPQESAQ